MPVPTYPSAITLTDIQTEFGGSNPVALDEYYAGGTYVFSGTANSTGTDIPSTGAINFLNFSGASAGRYWYYKRIPSTQGFGIAFVSTLEVSRQGGYLIRGGGFSNGPYPYVMAIPINTGNTTWQSEPRIGSANALITGAYTQLVSISPNSTFSMAVGTQGATTLITRFYTANGARTANANTTGMGGWFKMIATDTGYIKVQPGYNTANLVIGKWSGAGDTLDYWWAASLGNFYSVGAGLYNSDDSHLILGFYYSTGTKPALYSFNASDGSFAWGYTLGSTVVGVPTTESVRTDSSNNFAVRFSSYTRDFARFTDNGATATEQWRKAVPSGNTITLITNDFGGNIYVCCAVGWNASVTKVQSDGTVSWTRRFRSVRADSGQQGVSWSRVTVTAAGIFALVRTEGYNFNTAKSQWESSGIYEQHLLRIPIDGTKTGTYSNLVYESDTSMSLTAQTAFGLTSNTISNTTLLNFPTALTSNTKANTLQLVANSSLSFTSTTIS
jgi:hypothetical protein